jgi:DNA-binding MarR family transcriptional regulator
LPKTSKYASVYDLLFSCHHLLERKVELALGGTDLHVASYRVLDLADRFPGIGMGEITKRLLVTGGNTTNISNRLVKLGLLTREYDQNDRRILRAKVSARGRARARAARKAVEDELKRTFGALPVAELSTLNEELDGLTDRLAGNN